MVSDQYSDGSRGFLLKAGPWSPVRFIFLILIGSWLGLAGGLSSTPARVEETRLACFYQRERAACGQNEELLQVLIVGDVMLGRSVDLRRQPFQKTAHLLQTADIRVANFEGALSNSENTIRPRKPDSDFSSFSLTAPQSSVEVLQSAGFNVVTLANNHSLDAGRSGLEYTVNTLERAGIKIVGAGNSDISAFSPVVFRARGIGVAFIGVNAIPYPLQQFPPGSGDDWRIADWDAERLSEAIRSARGMADVVVVLVHWGDEYQLNPGYNQRLRASELIDLGADAVIGSHAHTPQATEIFTVSKSRKSVGFAAYSLGNFVSDQADSRAQSGLALWLGFDRDGLAEVRAGLVHAGTLPDWVNLTDHFMPILKYQPAPQRLVFMCTHDSCERVETASPGFSEQEKSHQIDLTGDGVPESIVLIEGKLSIYEGVVEVYRSSPGWNVLDFALGDPNHDGRFEVVLALEKPDASGEMKSHPFVVGYRGGIYRLLWGGSAVPHPILEIEETDLDGDREDELIVLDDRGNGLRTLSVWRFDNWFFSQVWASTPDQYQGLSLSRQVNSPPLILVSRKW